MSNYVTTGVTVDTTQAEMSIADIKAKADAVTQEWKINRNTILRQVREGFTLISSLMSTFRQAMTVFGQTIDPFFSSLVGMVLSTVSMLISSATVLAGTGIFAMAGAAILGLAIGFQIIALGQLLADKAKVMGLISDLQGTVSALGMGMRKPSGFA